MRLLASFESHTGSSVEDSYIRKVKASVSARVLHLDSSIAGIWIPMAWLGATILFVLVIRLFGGPTTADSYVSVNSTWAIAHGNIACAFPPSSTLPQPLSAPVYTLLSGGLSAVFRIGHAVAFPARAQMGIHCQSATEAINRWSVHTGALFPTVLLGYVCWLFLAAGVVVLLRSVGRGMTRWEPFALTALAISPPVSMCLLEYFHPQDLVAVGFICMGLAAALRNSWGWSGAAMALGVLTQQFAVLALIPLIFVMTRNGRFRFLAVGPATFIAVSAPLLIVTSGRALHAIVIGTGSSTMTGTLLVDTRLHGALLQVTSRGVTIVFVVVLCVWARLRYGSNLLNPRLLTSLIATSLALRLVFEVNLWGYYFAAASVLVIALHVIERRVSLSLIVFFVVVTFASADFGLANRPPFIEVPISIWQIVLVPWILILAARPLLESNDSLTGEFRRTAANSM